MLFFELIVMPFTSPLYVTLVKLPSFLLILAEVELLLEPEEKAILEQNEYPVLSKISTVKSHKQCIVLSFLFFFFVCLMEYCSALFIPHAMDCSSLNFIDVGQRSDTNMI